jgi:hypothetical protein
MPFAISPATNELACQLAAISGLTPDEAVATALRAELDRKQAAAPPRTGHEPTVEEIMADIRSLGPWTGPTGAEMLAELYDDYGLPR